MMDGSRDDAVSWMNYTAAPSTAERARLLEIVGDAEFAQRLLDFGMRPLSVLDDDPTIAPSPLDKPFSVEAEQLSDSNILVDINTGHRFECDSVSGTLWFDLIGSNNFADALEILQLASIRDRRGLPFRRLTRPSMALEMRREDAPLVPPLELHTGINGTLADILGMLAETFCERCGAKSLWLRGQRTEYRSDRDSELTAQLYGQKEESSLVPSLGRFVLKNPDAAGFSLAFFANHAWKKPFLIWLILENAHWFGTNSGHVTLLKEILADPDDERFIQLLCEIQMMPSLFANSVSGNLNWPSEVDDLRQWFFAFMKRSEFGITLQQYGYPTSLLDVTTSVDVALYFSQARIVKGRLQLEEPRPGRLIYVFAERGTGDFFRHGIDLFWGDEGWTRTLPPRLAAQNAGFINGSS